MSIIALRSEIFHIFFKHRPAKRLAPPVAVPNRPGPATRPRSDFGNGRSGSDFMPCLRWRIVTNQERSFPQVSMSGRPHLGGRELSADMVGSDDEAMRVALRIIEEGVTLSEKMAEDARRNGFDAAATLNKRRADEGRQHIETLRSAILGTDLPGPTQLTNKHTNDDCCHPPRGHVPWAVQH